MSYLVVKTRKCKICRTVFAPRSMSHKCCSPDCALSLVEKERSKTVKEAVKAHKGKINDTKPISFWLDKAQTSFNRYVRARDRNLGCISCDKPEEWDGQWHAGHFKSVGADSYLRFNLWNVHKQCVQCNHFLSGNVQSYGLALVERIGKDRLEFLESSPKTRRYTREYLERLTDIFNRKYNRLKKRHKL